MALNDLIALLQIVFIDVAMAGDNALVVGTAAAGLPKEDRRRVVLIGIAAATLLRIVFAFFAVKLLHIIGLLLAGGLVLLWVAYALFRDIQKNKKSNREAMKEKLNNDKSHNSKKMSQSIWTIVLADISMSLDNILAVAGVARDHLLILIIGLILSVGLMGVAASLIAKLVHRHSWIAYIGFVVVLYAALSMVWDGARQLNLL